MKEGRAFHLRIQPNTIHKPSTFPPNSLTALAAGGSWAELGMVGVPSGVPGAEGAELSEAVVVVTGDKGARWQNLIPSFPWIVPPRPPPRRNPRKGRDQILPSGNHVAG